MEGLDAMRVRCIAPYTAIFGLIQQLSIQRNIQQTIQQTIQQVCPSERFAPVGRPQMPETTATFLAKHELSSYTAAFDEHGWDSLPALQGTSPTMTSSSS